MSRIKMEIEQWASKVISFSSEYGSSWTADCILGPPHVYPKHGDVAGTWSHLEESSSMEYLELEFPESVYAKTVQVYETFNSGNIVKIDLKGPGGKWFEVFKLDSDPVPTEESQIFSPPFKPPNFKTNTVKITLDCSQLSDDWCELDAVKLTGTKYDVESPPPVTTLINDMSSLVNNEEFSDVVIEAGGQKFHCHRAILAARSSYFKAMFSDKFKSSSKAMVIEDITAESFLNVLQYLYTNEIKPDISPLSLVELTRAADRLTIDGLFKLGIKTLCTIINSSNVVPIYREVTEKLPALDAVSETCIDYMSYNMAEVSKQVEFTELPKALMLEIIQKSSQQLCYQ